MSLEEIIKSLGPLPTTLGKPILQKRVEELEAAILDVVTQKLDNICWMDVYTKLSKLVEHEFNPLLLPKKEFDYNCSKFSNAMYSLQSYRTDKLTEYIELLEVVAEEHRQAKLLLEKAGYGVTGTPLLERLKEALNS